MDHYRWVGVGGTYAHVVVSDWSDQPLCVRVAAVHSAEAIVTVSNSFR